MPAIVREVLRDIGYDRAKYGFDCDTCGVLNAIHDQSPDIAQKYGVMSVPTLMVFENGQVKNQAVACSPKQNILVDDRLASCLGLRRRSPLRSEGAFFAPACPDVARAYRSSAGSRGVSPTTQARWQSQRPVSSDAVRR